MVVIPNNLELKKGEQAVVTINLITADGCSQKIGEIVKAKVAKGAKSVSLSSQKTTTQAGHTSAEAGFIITAKGKKGKAKIKFKYEKLKVIFDVTVVK